MGYENLQPGTTVRVDPAVASPNVVKITNATNYFGAPAYWIVGGQEGIIKASEILEVIDEPSRKVYALTHRAPDYSAGPGRPASIHRTLEGAKKAFADGKYVDSWTESSQKGTWYGPDGFGSIKEFTLDD